VFLRNFGYLNTSQHGVKAHRAKIDTSLNDHTRLWDSYSAFSEN
jgi:hypothetical protein